MDFFSFFICGISFCFLWVGLFLVLVLMCSLSLRGDPASRSLLPSFPLQQEQFAAAAEEEEEGEQTQRGRGRGRLGGPCACPPERRRWGLLPTRDWGSVTAAF